MMDDKIGTIGSTHGVNDRPRPSKANKGRITNSLPLLSAASTRPLSDGGATLTGAGAGASLVWSTTVASAFGTALTATPAVTGASSTGEAAPAVEAGSAATGVALDAAAFTGAAGGAAAGAEPSPVKLIFASIGA